MNLLKKYSLELEQWMAVNPDTHVIACFEPSIADEARARGFKVIVIDNTTYLPPDNFWVAVPNEKVPELSK